ncbi:MAG TPA: hypothetical protein PLV52_06330, partial [Candidatus Omnitrophota bacterium]|nr:hypothetical protein [Candidatus Omnitrophota bacterium]
SDTLPVLSGLEAFTAAAAKVGAGSVSPFEQARRQAEASGAQDQTKDYPAVESASTEFEITPSAAQGVTKAFQEFFEASIGSSRQKKAIAEMERYPEAVYAFAREILYTIETGNAFSPAFGKNAKIAYDSALKASMLRGRMTKGDPRFNNLKALMEKTERTIPHSSPLRATDRRSAPGKSSQAALQVIVFDKALQSEPFTVTDYLASYQEAAPVFGYEILSERRPDDTARRDFKGLIALGYLKASKRRGEYELTSKGRTKVAELAIQLDPVINKDIMSFIPQEIIDALDNYKGKKMVVGVPTEIKRYAERVGLTPAGVKALVSLGITVIVQRGAGREHFKDEEYMAAGARMADTASEVWAVSDIIKKVKEPLNSEELGINELDMMRPGQIVYTYLHLASPDCRDLAYSMFQKGVTGIAYETIIVVDESGKKRTPVLEPMSVIAGHLGGYFGVIYSLWSETVRAAGKDTVRLSKTGKNMMARVKSDYTHARGFRGVANGKKAVVMGGGISGLAAARTLLKYGVQV